MSKTTAELARDFYYHSQFGFTQAPVTVGDGGNEKLRRFAKALCNVAGADGCVSKEERDFIQGYCSSKGYPQSIIDAIPNMCDAAESMAKKSLEAVISETEELLTMGTLKFTARQIIYDAIRASAADGLDEKEKLVLESLSKSLGLGSDELDNILALVEKEKVSRDERIKILFPEGHPCLPSE